MLKTVNRNINVFGLVFTITVSCVIDLVDLILIRILTMLRELKKMSSARIDRWIQDGVFQLQRRAYEAQGEGSWKRLTTDNPVTVKNTKFKDLPIESVYSVHLSPISQQEKPEARTTEVHVIDSRL